MALQFQPPPDWLLQEYMKRKVSPVATAAQGAQDLLGTYATMQQQQGAQQSSATDKLLKLIEMDPELANSTIGQRLMKQGGLSNADFQPPTPSSGTVASPQTAGLPNESGSPVVANDMIARSRKHWGLSDVPTEQLAGRGKLGQKELASRKTNLEMQKLEQGMEGKGLFNKKGEKIADLPPNAQVVDDTAGRGYQFVGTQGNMAARFDPNTGTISETPLPGGGPLQPRVAPSIPGSEVSKIGELGNLQQKMKVLRENYSKDYVGMFDAPAQALRQKTGFGASAQAATFRQTSQDIKDSLLRARSGAQINEQEYQRLLPLVPNETSSEIDFMAKADRFDQVLNEMLSSKQGAFSRAGYRPMAGAQQTLMPTPGMQQQQTLAPSTQFAPDEEAQYQQWKASQGR